MRDDHDFSKTRGRKNPYALSTKIKYTDEPLGEIQVIPDFLPSPAELAFREEGVKVTLALSKKSVEFFKAEASRHHTQYQRMIRRLLDAYVDTQPSTLTRRSARTTRKRAVS
jgi:predicted DNA binding CopG/RHH family protein